MLLGYYMFSQTILWRIFPNTPSNTDRNTKNPANLIPAKYQYRKNCRYHRGIQLYLSRCSADDRFELASLRSQLFKYITSLNAPNRTLSWVISENLSLCELLYSVIFSVGIIRLWLLSTNNHRQTKKLLRQWQSFFLRTPSLFICGEKKWFLSTAGQINITRWPFFYL